MTVFFFFLDYGLFVKPITHIYCNTIKTRNLLAFFFNSIKGGGIVFHVVLDMSENGCLSAMDFV